MSLRLIAFFLSLILVLQAEARRPRDRDGWDELKDEIRCVYNVRKFLSEKNYLGGLKFNEELLTIDSYSGTPLNKIKCREDVVEGIKDGIGRCGRNIVYRFTGMGIDCPHRYVELIEFESTSGQRYEAKIVQDDNCDREPTGELFTKRKITKKPESIRDEVMIREAKQALKEAAMDTYRAINVSREYAGKSAQQISAQLEHTLGQNVFKGTTCAVAHSRDSEIGEVMRAAANRACAEKLRLYPNERCMISMPDFRYDATASTAGMSPQQCQSSNAFINCDVIPNGATAEPFTSTRTPKPPRPPAVTNCETVAQSQRANCLRNLADYQRDLARYQQEIASDRSDSSTDLPANYGPCSNSNSGQVSQDGRCETLPPGTTAQPSNPETQVRPEPTTPAPAEEATPEDDDIPND